MGNFIKGLRDGKGKLFDKTNKIVREGIWIKDKFMGSNSAPYYADIAVAASKINPLQNPFVLDAEIITIPTLNMENTFVVSVVGDSMSPTFSENDLIICKALHDIYNLNERDAYVIFDGTELVLKKIQRVTAQNRVDKLMLISENCKKYPMRFIEPNEETKIFQVAAHISIRDKTMIQQMLQHEVSTLPNHVSMNKQTFWKI
jgi:SOS-response transcriptional repressor LexA